MQPLINENMEFLWLIHHIISLAITKMHDLPARNSHSTSSFTKRAASAIFWVDVSADTLTATGPWLWSIFEKSKFYTFLVMGQKVKQGWDRLLPSMFNEKSVVSFTNDFQSYKLNYFTVLAIKSQILAKNIFGSVIIYFWKVCYFYFLSYYFLSEHKSISSAIFPF